MAKVIIDVPDDFKNHLVYIAAETGKTLKFQVLEALIKEWKWPQSRMPRDGRFKLLDPSEPEIMTGGQTPRGSIPLDKDGNHDFTPVHERMKAAEEFMVKQPPEAKKKRGTPAVHPDDEGKDPERFYDAGPGPMLDELDEKMKKQKDEF